MSTKSDNKIASIVCLDNKLFGVTIEKNAQGIKIVQSRSGAKCDGDAYLSMQEELQGPSGDGRAWPLVVGFDGANVLTYRVPLPNSDQVDYEAIMIMQSESVLPLPKEQMSYDWQIVESLNGVGASGVVVAAKSFIVKRFVDQVKHLKPSKIGLSTQGVVKCWTTFIGGGLDREVVAYWHQDKIELMLIQNNQFISASVIYLDDAVLASNTTVLEIRNKIEGVLLHFNVSGIEVHCISDETKYGETIQALQSQGLNVVQADLTSVSELAGINNEEVISFFPAIGLALLHDDVGSNRSLNIFESFYMPPHEDQRKSLLPNMPTLLAITASMILLVVVSNYWLLLQKNAALTIGDEHIATVNQILEAQKVKRHIYTNERVDLLDLFTRINPDGVTGVTLDGLDYKKGKVVTVTGRAKDNKQLDLLKRYISDLGFTEVKIKASPDQKKKDTVFALTFKWRK